MILPGLLGSVGIIPTPTPPVGTTYATWDTSVTHGGTITFLNDLEFTAGAPSRRIVPANMGKTTGRWYYEITGISATNNSSAGAWPDNATLLDYLGDSNSPFSLGWYQPDYYKGAGAVGMGGTHTDNDVMGFLIDLDARTMDFYLNGVHLAQTSLPGSAGPLWYPAACAVDQPVTMQANFGPTLAYPSVPLDNAANSGWYTGPDPVLAAIWDPQTVGTDHVLSNGYLTDTVTGTNGDWLRTTSALTSGVHLVQILHTTSPGSNRMFLGVRKLSGHYACLFAGTSDSLIYLTGVSQGNTGITMSDGDHSYHLIDLDAGTYRAYKDQSTPFGPAYALPDWTPGSAWSFVSMADNAQTFVRTADFGWTPFTADGQAIALANGAIAWTTYVMFNTTDTYVGLTFSNFNRTVAIAGATEHILRVNGGGIVNKCVGIVFSAANNVANAIVGFQKATASQVGDFLPHGNTRRGLQTVGDRWLVIANCTNGTLGGLASGEIVFYKNGVLWVGAGPMVDFVFGQAMFAAVSTLDHTVTAPAITLDVTDFDAGELAAMATYSAVPYPI